MAAPLGHDSQPLPAVVKEIVTKARTTWLKNDEVLKILQHYKSFDLPIGKEAPKSPGGGLLFLFNRKAVRFFRKDGHEWRKKADGKTVRETHEKLKIGNREVLNCYYAHSEAQEALQRRCYWLLEGNGDIVLVHYLSLHPTAHASVQGAVQVDRPEDRANQAGLDLARQGSGRHSGGSGMGMDRSSSTPVQSNHCLPSSSMTTARSLDRQNSLGPLHTAPSFSAGTVQTGSTLEGPLRSTDAALWQSSQAIQQEAGPPRSPSISILDSPISHPGIQVVGRDSRAPSSERNSPSNSIGPALDLQRVQGEQEVHARAWEALKRKEREAAESTDDTLKPAASLTRVDSDTLKVAPSLSGATGGSLSEVGMRAFRPAKSAHAIANAGLRSALPSPFLAAAHLGHVGGGKPQNLIEEVLEQQGKPAAPSFPVWTGQRLPPSILLTKVPASEFDSANSERIKRYRSGDVTGSNHSFAPSLDPAEMSSAMPDVTSSASMQAALAAVPSERVAAGLPQMPRMDVPDMMLNSISQPPSTWLNEGEHLGQIPRHFRRDANFRWQPQESLDFTQGDKFARDLDLLLPVDLDWAMNLSCNECEDTRHC